VSAPVDDRPQILADVRLAIDPDEVLRFQGYKQGVDVPGPDVLALFDEALGEGRRLIAPRAVVRWRPVVDRRGDTLDVGGAVLHIPGIAAAWGEIDRVAVAICTIGDALETRVRALWDAREFPLAVMLDSVGSGAVESFAEYVNDALCQQGIAAAVRVTNRISPGYGAWDVTAQRAMFSLCPGDGAGVVLNEACFMTPEKSISLLVGAGAAARVDHYFSQCTRCWMRDCAYRRAPAGRTVHR
jgi:hypothetical protein